MGSGGKSGADAMKEESRLAREEEAARQERIREGLGSIDETFGSFDEDFYSDRREAYMDFASPKLDDQFKEVSKDATFDMARRGVLDSSMRGETEANLNKQYDEGYRSLVDNASGIETQTQADVEAARSGLISNLYATGNAEAAANGAVARAGTLSGPSNFDAVGTLVSDSLSGISKQYAAEKMYSQYGALGAPAPSFNTGLYNSLNNVKVR
jgi:hypothetical protein